MSGWRLVGPVILATACLVALCTFIAVSLFHQQATMARVLRENVHSRRAAADLRGCLNTLVALETHHVESVADVHARAQTHLHEIRVFANHPTELALSGRLEIHAERVQAAHRVATSARRASALKRQPVAA